MKKIICGFFLVVMSLFVNSCGGTEYTSKWADKPITLSGTETDWTNKTAYIQDEGILFGVQNDKDNIYLFMSTNDQAKIRQLMGRGLIVWLDREGGDNKKFGIKYPIGFFGSGEMPQRRDDTQQGDMMKERIDRMSQEFEIYEPDSKTWTRMSFAQVKGIEGKITRHDERVVYELKISRTSQNSDFFLMASNNKIGLGLETPEIDLSKMRDRAKTEGGGEGEPAGGMSGGGGMGGMGGGHRGGGGGRGGEGGRQRPDGQGGNAQKQMKYWVTVNLAEKP